MQSEVWPLRTGPSPKLNAQGWISSISFDASAATIEWESLSWSERLPGPCALRDAYTRKSLPCNTSAPRQALLDIAPSRARENLRRRVRASNLRGNEKAIIGFHGFRRGRARDEYRAGTPLTRILDMGGLKSSSVLRYFAIRELDQVAVLNSSLDGSDSD